MKSFLRFLLFVLIIELLTVPVFANDYLTFGMEIPKTITVQLNGENLDFTDSNGNKVEPQIINNRTMVPMRKIFEALGASVEWNNNTRSIIANKDGVEIFLQIDNPNATVTSKDGVKKISLDSVPTIVNNRTLVPVRFIAESLDKIVGWNSMERAVIIFDVGFVENEIKEKSPYLYEFLNEDYQKIVSYDAEMNMGASSKISRNGETTTIKVRGNGEAKYKNDLLSVAFNFNFKGTDKELLEELSSNQVDLNMIVDFYNKAIYLKSSILECYDTVFYTIKVPSGKWLIINEDDLNEEGLELMKSMEDVLKSSTPKMTLSEAIKAVFTDDYYYTTSTFEKLRNVTNIFTSVFSENNFTRTYTNLGKQYKLSADLSDLVDIINGSERESYDLPNDYHINLTIKIEDNITKHISLDFGESEKNSSSDDSMISLGLEYDVKSYNQDVKINVPSARDVVTLDEVRVGDSKLKQSLNFYEFTNKLSQLQDDVICAVEDSKFDVVMASLSSKTVSQLRNYLARGGNINDFDTDDKWLGKSYANVVVTQIDPEGKFGKKYLPEFKVDTPMQDDLQVSYFVTAKGTVFCWPPYIYNDRAFVNVSTTAKKNGEEISDIKSALMGEVTIDFYNGETVKVVNGAQKNVEAGLNYTDGSTASVFFRDRDGESAKGLKGWEKLPVEVEQPKKYEQEYTAPTNFITYGDVNGDWWVNENDAILLRDYCRNNNVSINEKNADVDADGKITIRDRLILERKTSGVEGYETLPYKGSFLINSHVGLEHNQKIVSAETAEELIQAIDSDTRIILTGEFYNISEALLDNNNKHIIDGRINGISNMVIESELGAEILIDDPYSVVLFFDDCEDITLNNLVVGHSAMAGCMSGVIEVKNCGQINLINCDIYGCGAYGVCSFYYLDSSDIAIPLYIDNCYIHDCDHDGFSFFAPVDALIQNSYIYNVECLFNIYDCNIDMVNCKIFNIEKRWGNDTHIIYLGDGNILNMKDCNIRDCSADVFIKIWRECKATANISNCTFVNNNFPSYLTEGMEENVTMKNNTIIN